MAALTFLWSHKTKVLGVLQIIASQVATAGVLSQASVPWLMLASGILTSLVGFINSAKTEPTNE
jgi:hypothetical protein